MASPKLNGWIVLCVSALCFQVTLSACPDGWLLVNTSSTPAQACYKIFSTQSQTFDGAATFCISQGGYLARETSAAVHASLKPNVIAETIAHPNTNFWIGLTDNNTNGQWVWIGGGNVGSYTNFGNRNSGGSRNRRDCGFVSVGRGSQPQAQPNRNNDFRWRTTTNCNQKYALICQREVTAPPLATTTPRPMFCPIGWSGSPSQRWCIQLVTNPLSWTSARQQCQSNGGGDLVRLNNTALNNFVNNLINANKGVYWIGLNDRRTEGAYVWLDDRRQANFTQWDTGAPNNSKGNENCVAVDANKGDKWDDLDCNTTNRFICQRLPYGAGGGPGGGGGGGRPFFPIGPTVSHTNCGRGWEDVTDSDTCIDINLNPLSWLDAQAACISQGGDLASIANVQEQTYISARVAAFPSSLFWIGANDRVSEKGFRWSDDTPFAFLNWDDKQPDDSGDSDCTVMSQKTGRWNDVPCESRNAYICKKKGSVTLASLVTTTTVPPHIPAGQMWGCPAGWENFRGSCYKVVQVATGVDWATASASCGSPNMKGSLAAIIDADENKFILSQIPSDNRGYAWIGLQDPQENTFTWVDGTPVQYTNWENGEPNNQNNEDCVVFKGDNGRWNDIQCANVYTMYICKKSKSILPRAGSDQEQGCVNGSLGYGAQCYSYITPPKNFYDAQKDCKARSQNLGNLATVDSGHLQAFLSAELDTSPGKSYWIGLQQSNTAYKWQSNWPVSFTYWGKNHTGNERGTCVGMQHSGLWVDYPCSQTNMSYICESPRTGFTTATTRAALTNQGSCPKGWTGYGPWCYQVFASNLTDKLAWTEARDFCANQATGGSLISVANNATQTWLANFVASNNATGIFWIGLNDRDTEASYTWLDNSPYLFTNWMRGQPDNQGNRQDCVEWVLPRNSWNDDYCYIARNWICQVPRGSVITTPKTPPTGAQSTSLCGNSSWTLFNRHCYFVSASDGDQAVASWYDARQTCISMRADLASINSDDENGFVTTLISKNPTFAFWIGLNDLNTDALQWSDQSPVSYVSWARNEPNDNNGGESCVAMISFGTWADNNCGKSLGYVCEKWAGNYQRTPYIFPPPTGGCPSGFVSIPALSYCYYIGGTTNATRQNFSNAVTTCQKLVPNANLASIHSSTEEKFIVTLLANVRTAAWIGFHDEAFYNQFEWVDNLPVTYTNWGPGQPDENRGNRRGNRRDCVDIETRRNKVGWYDRNCNTPLAYVCEARKDPSLATSAPNTTGCHQGYQRFRNSCYRFFKDGYTWLNAESTCKVDGGNLATVSSGTEQAFVDIVSGHVNDSLKFWVGLKYDQASSSFSWQDGWPVRYTNWGQGEPNIKAGMSCVTQTLDGQWNVNNCSSRQPFVCEINLGSPPPATRPSRLTANCPNRGWFSFRGNCYRLETSSLKSWSAAGAACTVLGASLASVHSRNEANYLSSRVKNVGHDVWIGLYKNQATGFAWNDNTELEYLNWETGEPNNPDSTLHQDCGKILAADGKWADTDCFDLNAYLCKITNVINSAESDTSTSSLAGGAVAGIVIGVLVLVALAGVIGFFVFKRTNSPGVSAFRKQPLPNPEPGFDNASYSTSGAAQVSSSDA